MMKKINLPTEPRYGIAGLSWSTVLQIEANPDRWYDEAFGIIPKRKPSEAMVFGSFIHDQIEKRKIHVPHGHFPEQKMSAEIKYTKTKSFNMIGTPDDYGSKWLYEYKTGKLWTQKQAKDHGQLKTYCALIEMAKGIKIRKAKLVSLETTYEQDKNLETSLTLSGNVRIFDVVITDLDILKIKARFVKAYKIAMETIERRSLKN